MQNLHLEIAVRPKYCVTIDNCRPKFKLSLLEINLFAHSLLFSLRLPLLSFTFFLLDIEKYILGADNQRNLEKYLPCVLKTKRKIRKISLQPKINFLENKRVKANKCLSRSHRFHYIFNKLNTLTRKVFKNCTKATWRRSRLPWLFKTGPKHLALLILWRLLTHNNK